MKQVGGELRASHFALGNTTQPNQFVSTMKMNFNKGDKVGAQSSVRDKLNVRASHFDLGEHKNNYSTSFKTHYPAHLTFENAKLDDEKKHDLRTNHFVLGHQDGNRQSITKQTYTEKEIHSNVHNEQEAQKIKMRAHHHTFAETEPKPMRTYYNEQYQAYPQQDLLQSKRREELQEKAIGLRQSHIILGKEKLPMHSIQQLEYVVKDGGAQRAVKIPPQQSHFALGTSQNDFKTVNQEFYTPQLIEKSAFAADNQENLRATHFTLGQDGQPYKTETQSNYRPIHQEAISYKNNLPGLQANHFSLGDKNSSNSYQTQYLATMKPPMQDQHQAQMRDQRNDRGSNFVIGSMDMPYHTESNSNYQKPMDGRPATLDARLMKDLRSSHFRFNDVATNQFIKKGIIKGQGQLKPNALDPVQEANLRSHHFQLGYTNPPYISTAHDTHRPLEARPNQLDARLAKDLRSHHFELS